MAESKALKGGEAWAEGPLAPFPLEEEVDSGQDERWARVGKELRHRLEGSQALGDEAWPLLREGDGEATLVALAERGFFVVGVVEQLEGEPETLR